MASGSYPLKPFQIRSHGNLLQFPAISHAHKDTPPGAQDISTPLVDAIVVPTFRPAEEIRYAAELASQARCQLLALYTNEVPLACPQC